MFIAPVTQAQITGPEETRVVGPDGVALTGIGDYSVPAELGRTRESNLFHQFLEFNVASGDRVTFTGPDTIVNIIGRITDDQPSQIYGTVRSDIEGANLFLLNPLGIMFGPTASLDVKGSFYVSTADSIRFADDTIFTGDLGNDGSLTVEPPEAFGFTGNSSGIGIVINILRRIK